MPPQESAGQRHTLRSELPPTHHFGAYPKPEGGFRAHNEGGGAGGEAWYLCRSVLRVCALVWEEEIVCIARPQTMGVGRSERNRCPSAHCHFCPWRPLRPAPTCLTRRVCQDGEWPPRPWFEDQDGASAVHRMGGSRRGHAMMRRWSSEMPVHSMPNAKAAARITAWVWHGVVWVQSGNCYPVISAKPRNCITSCTKYDTDPKR